ncbi:MAG: LLM class flavin-dependent oxidoreductase [Candidatus Ranarchaeia archaeon]
MKFGLIPHATEPFPEMIKIAQTAENSGFDSLWLTDENPSTGFRDCFITLAVLAEKTKKITLGTAINTPYTRHPALLAVSAEGIHELSNGRFKLGIGPGGSLTLGPLGIKMWDRPIRMMRESVEALKLLFSGETVNYEGKMISVKNVQLKYVDPLIEVYVAARGPQMYKLSGKYADGCLMSGTVPTLPNSIKLLEEGARQKNRDISKFEKIQPVALALEPDMKKATRMVAGDVSFVIMDSPDFMLEQAGINIDAANKVREGMRKGGLPEAQKHFTEKMADVFCLIGDVKHLIERAEEFNKVGVDQLLVGAPYGTNPLKSLETFGKEVASRFQ